MPKTAFIEENQCIGCTKCMAVCPSDAIIGTDKMLHTVLTLDCIGCELCVPACPVDCITLLPMPSEYDLTQLDPSAYRVRHTYIKKRIARRKHRLVQEQKRTAEADQNLDPKAYLASLL